MAGIVSERIGVTQAQNRQTNLLFLFLLTPYYISTYAQRDLTLPKWQVYNPKNLVT
jgi:hypothetical protein